MYLGHWGKSEKLGPNTPNHGHVYTESHPKCSTADFTSNEALLKRKGHLRIELYIPVLVYLDIGTSHGNWAQKPQNKGHRYTEGCLKCQTLHFTLSEALLKGKGDLRVASYLLSVFGHWGKLRELSPKTINTGHMDTQKVIQSVKLHISHQMKLCSSVKVI